MTYFHDRLEEIKKHGSVDFLKIKFGLDEIAGIEGFLGSWLVLTLFTYPYVQLICSSALRNLDSTVEDAARSLGVNQLRVYTNVVIPRLKKPIIYSGLLVGLYVISDFGAVSLLRYKTFTWSIYNQYEASFDRSSAALLSIILCLVATLFIYMESVTKGKTSYFRTSMGTARERERFDIGWWKIPSILACFTVAFISVILPS